MKKKLLGVIILLLVIILAVYVIISMQHKESGGLSDTENDNIEECVILGNYKGIEVEKNMYIISEEKLDNYMQSKIETYNEESGETVTDINDEWVKMHTDYETVEDFREALRSQLQKTYDAKSENELEELLFEKVRENSQIVAYPEGLLEEKIQEYSDQIETYLKNNEITREDFLEAMGYSEDDFQNECEEHAKTELEKELVIQALMKEEGLEIGDDAYQKYEQDLAELLGYDDVEKLYEAYSEEDIQETVIWDEITDILIRYADITEKTVAVSE